MNRATELLASLSVLVIVATGSLAAQEAAVEATQSVAATGAVTLQRATIAVARRVQPSIVTIRGFERIAETGEGGEGPQAGWREPTSDDPYPGYRQYAACSGFVVEASGEVLTVQTLLAKPDGSLPDLVDIETFDRTRIVAEIVGAEPTVNLAIVQAMVFPNGHSRTLPALEFGDSDAMLPGSLVVCAGDPAGPERFLSLGTFIALPERDCYQDLLSAFYQQLGAIVPPEAYGGPVTDLEGRVIGVLAPRQLQPGPATAPKTGIEYALPSKIVTGLHQTIRQMRSFRSPWLGFAVMSRPEIAAVRGIEAFQAMDKPRAGILIENVFDPSPAAAAGVRPGDWLVGFGQARIFTPVEFQRCLYLAGIGKQVSLELYRDGEIVKVELEVQQRPAAAKPR